MNSKTFQCVKSTHSYRCYPNFAQKVFICTTSALNAGYCKPDQLGRFILTLPDGKKITDSSIWSARVELPDHKAAREPTTVSSNGFWNNPPNGSFPTPPASQYDTPWKRGRVSMHRVSSHHTRGEEHTGVFTYEKPIHYPVPKTGYYCVGTCHDALCQALILSLHSNRPSEREP